MPRQSKKFAPFGTVTVAPLAGSPWKDGEFVPDTARLAALLSVVAKGKDSWIEQTAGAVGTALDIYGAGELRRAGWERNAVWPLPNDPRVLPADIADALDSLRRDEDRDTVAVRRVLERAGSTQANVIGEFFTKQIDILVSSWDRGPEVMISTKSQLSSWGKNLPNRQEEAVGDIANLRGRFPMAAMGMLYMVDHRIVTKEPGSWTALCDLLRKIRLVSTSGRPAYDASALVMAEAVRLGEARLVGGVPEDLSLARFWRDLVNTALVRQPANERVTARQFWRAGQKAGVEAPEQVIQA